MIQNYQQRKRLEERKPPTSMYATITAISGGRARIRFGDGTTSQKYYKLNTAYSFSVGDKVQIAKRSGTYVIEFPF